MMVRTKKIEKIEDKKRRAQKVLSLLEKNYPDAHCALTHNSPFELLIATILSAQCTDERVNKVTPELFKKLPTPQAFSRAELSVIENLVRSTGFYKNKARNIKNCSQILVEKYQSEVPKTMEELSALPGVGRKTANVVLGNSYGIPGLVVDTHVMRLSNRLGLARGKDAVKLEFDLHKLIPENKWTMYSHYLISHGRKTCKARSPDCSNCFLKNLCPQMNY